MHEDRRDLALYAAGGIVYVCIGAFVPDFLFSWVVAAAFLVAWVLVVPAAIRLIRRR